jgi:hypothetical protein
MADESETHEEGYQHMEENEHVGRLIALREVDKAEVKEQLVKQRTGTLRVRNVLHDFPVMYKVKTTDSKKFRFHASTGQLAPGASGDFTIMLYDERDKREHECKLRILAIR